MAEMASKKNGPSMLPMSAEGGLLLLLLGNYKWWKGDQRPSLPGWLYFFGCRWHLRLACLQVVLEAYHPTTVENLRA